VHLTAGDVTLTGDLTVPDDARGVVLFAHGSGSGRHSPRNRYVAQILNERGLATLLADLLTAEEEDLDRSSGEFRSDVGLLADRLVWCTKWMLAEARTRELPIGYFGASTGTAAALVASTQVPSNVQSIVSRGGRPDLAGAALRRVRAPTLLIVGGNDSLVIELNKAALKKFQAPARIEIVPGAAHLFEEQGTLEQVALLAGHWFDEHLAGRRAPLRRAG